MIQFNVLLLVFLVIFLLRSATQYTLHWLNLAHLRQYGTTVPAVFQDTVDQETLKKISAYTIDSDHFHMRASLIHQGLYLSHGYNYIKVWKRLSIRGWSILFLELIHRIKQGLADAANIRARDRRVNPMNEVKTKNGQQPNLV